MALEPQFNNIDDLVPTNPADNDPVNEGDDHLRGIKSALKGNVLGDAAESSLLVAGSKAWRVLARTFRMIPDIDTAPNTLAFRNSADTVDRATAGVDQPGELRIDNQTTGQDVVIGTTTAPEGLVDSLRLLAAGGLEAVWRGLKVFIVGQTGIAARTAAGDSLTTIDLQNSSGVVVGQVRMEPLNVTQPVGLFALDNLGALTPVFVASARDGTGRAVLFHSGDAVAETQAEGIKVNREPTQGATTIDFLDDFDGNVIGQVTIDDVIGARLLANVAGMDAILAAGSNGQVKLSEGAKDLFVVQDNATTVNSKAFVNDASDLQRPVGFNIMPSRTSGVSTTIANTDNGGTLRLSTGGGIIVTVNATSLPADGVCTIKNTSGTTVTLAESGIQFQWFTGAGVVTGARTLADGGVCTIQRRDSSLAIDLWGNGLS